MDKTFKKYLWPGCTALVTGASSGMGLEYVRQLGAMGCNVLMVSNQEKELHQYADAFNRQFNAEFRPLFCDLSRLEAADELDSYCEENGLKIDILINNAGMFFFHELKGDYCRKSDIMLRLHILTPARLCEIFGNRMKERGGGYILNVSSVAAKMQFPGMVTYGSTKAFLYSFSRSLYYEMKPYHVGVTTICPGAVDTSLYSVLPQIDKLFKLGKKLGVVMTPEKLVRKALRAMFRKKRSVVPGFINHFFAPIVNLLPIWAVNRIWKKMWLEEGGKD